MQYTDLTAALQNYLEAAPVGQAPTQDFTSALSVIINNAELRIYRDIEFLALRGTGVATATAGNRLIDLLTTASIDIGRVVSGGTTVKSATAYPNPVRLESASVEVTPFGQSSPLTIQLEPASIDFIDAVWPNQQATAAPAYGSAFFCLLSDSYLVIAPTPDVAYPLVLTGIWRPAPMSAANPTTWLGEEAADLLFAACMCEASAFIRNFGAQSDDPRMAMSWEATYAFHKAGAENEERKRRGLPTAPMPPGAPAPMPTPG